MTDRVTGTADVTIVGAGLAGLSAAHVLEDSGATVQVVEASDRVGGRVLSHTLPGGGVLDLGAGWIGEGHDRMLALSARFGIATFPTYGAGRSGVVVREGKQVAPGDQGAVAIGPAIGALAMMAQDIDPAAPWEHPQAAEWDSITMEAWIRGFTEDNAVRAALRGVIEVVYAAEPIEVSLLHALLYARSGGGLGRVLSVEGGAQQTRVDGGAAAIATSLAGALKRKVHLGSPVTSIHSDALGTAVETRNVTFRSKRTIVAVAPAIAGRIRFTPALPPLRAQLLERAPQGSVIKVHVVYDRPFWRDEGRSGRASIDGGPLRYTFDATPPSGSPGVLVSFFEGSEARKFVDQTPEVRRAAALDCLVQAFGPAAGEPVDYVEHNWLTEEFTHGCYSAVLPPGAWSTCGSAIRVPSGRIHWAGTETSTEYYGYMEGAVRSGERAGREVLDELA